MKSIPNQPAALQAPAESPALKGRSLRQDAWRRFRRNRAAVISMALLLLVADSAVRVLPFVTELRLGIALSLLGAPFFLWLLLRMRKGLA